MTYDILGVGFGPSNLALAIAASEPRGRRRPAGRLPRAPAPVRLAPRHAARRRHHAGVVPQGPGDPAQPGQRLQLPVLPARARPARRLHQPQDPVPAAGRVPRLPRVGRGPGARTWSPTTRRSPTSGPSTTRAAPSSPSRSPRTTPTVGSRCAGPATWWWPSGCRRPCRRGVTRGPRVWHNLDLLQRVEAFPTEPEPRRFVVVGAGQSAAEVVDFLHRRFPTAEVCSVFARYGYTPADDTPFANRIFDPEAVDHYFGAGDGVKRMLFDYHRNTNYSVVDVDLIEELYRREYQEQVLGRRRLRMMNASQVVGPRRPRRPRRGRRRVPAHGRARAPRRRRRRLRHRLPPGRRRRAPGRGRRPGRAAARRAARRRARLPPGPDPRRLSAGDLRPGRHRAHPRHHLDAAVQHRRPLGRDRRVGDGPGRPRPPGRRPRRPRGPRRLSPPPSRHEGGMQRNTELEKVAEVFVGAWSL